MNTQTIIVMSLGASFILITLIVCISVVWTALSYETKKLKDSNDRWKQITKK